MVKHIIIWKLRPELSEAEKEEAKAKIKAGLEGLKGIIPGLIEITVRIDFFESSTGDMMLDSTFTDEEALKGYQKNPEHLKVAQYVRSMVSDRSCVDYEM